MKERQRLLLVALVVILVVSWLWAASALWQYQSLRKQLKSLKEQVVETKGLIGKTEEQKERYEQLVRELGKPLAEFEPGRLIAKLMEQIEGALTQSRLRTETIQPIPWRIDPEMRAVRLSVQITATTTQPSISEGLRSLIELLMRLRSIRPPILVERLNIQTLTQPHLGLRVQAQMVWLVPVEEAVLKKWEVQTRHPLMR